MTKQNPMTDAERITAWLDGEGDKPDLPKAEIDALDIDITGLRSAMQPVLQEAPKPPTFLAEPTTGVSPAWRGLAVAACLACAMAVTAAVWPRGPELAGWKDYAVAYHALYRTETLAAAENDPDRQARELARVSTTLGADISGAGAVDGARFARAQILGFGDQPLVQLAYLTPGGNPIALCIMTGGDTAPLQDATRLGLPTVEWQADGLRYLLIGDAETEGLVELAEAFRAVL